jgi:hypothetical protein
MSSQGEATDRTDGAGDGPGHRVDPADEGRHVPDAEPLWNESVYLDVVADDGSVGAYVRIGLYPNLGVSWWTTMVVGPGRPMVASVAYDLPPPRGDETAVRSGGHDLAWSVDVPLEQLSVRATAPAVIETDPAASYHPSDTGTPTELTVDLAWRTDGVPYHYDVTTRYEIPCRVEGELRIGDERIAVRGQGQRDHSWGVRDWWAFGWCWSAVRLDDGTRLHGTDVRIPGMPVALGYVQAPGEPVRPVSVLEVSETLGRQGMPTDARIRIDPGGYDLAVDPVAFGPVLLTAADGRVSRFPRAMIAVTAADGRRGTGWIEWNQPQPPPG